jgi:hypothetical protein
MADLSITAASVKIHADGTSTTLDKIKLGEAATQGQGLYLNSGDSKYYKAKADSSGTATVAYIAMMPGSTNEYIYAAKSDAIIDIGATLSDGTTYVVSAGTAGGIAPFSDLTSGQYKSIVGVATDTDRLQLKFINTGDTV